MTHNSISLRKELYFKIMALCDMLWNDNFVFDTLLNDSNKHTIDKMYEVIESLALLAQLPLRSLQSSQSLSEHNEENQASKKGKTSPPVAEKG